MGGFLPFLPQIIFDLRHDFLQTKTILKLFTGNTGSLTISNGSLTSRFIGRIKTIGDIFQVGSGFDYLLWSVIFVGLIFLTIILIRKKKKNDQESTYLFQVSLISNLAMLIGILIVPFAIWPWYISSIQAGLIVLFLASIYWLVKNRPVFSRGLVFLFLCWIIWGTIKIDLWPIRSKTPIDPSNLKLRLSVIDKIYQDSRGGGLKIYSFAPNVYDYPYQYLIWYLAKEKYGYLPQEYVYLPNQPDYIPAKKEADSWLNKPPAINTYLIIEPFESQEKWYQDWRRNFPPPISQWWIGKTRIEKI